MDDMTVEKTMVAALEDVKCALALLQDESVEEAMGKMKECEKAFEAVLVQIVGNRVVQEALDILEHARDIEEAKVRVAQLAAPREVCKGIIID